MKLPRRPPPFDDELLTSWLVRTAAANGVKVHTLCARVMPREAVWNRDFDRIALDKHFLSLAEATGHEANQIRALTLRRYVNVIYRDYGNAAIVPWILPVGVYHRVRRSFGLMCCPLCVNERGYYRVAWRLAWMTVCGDHGTRLIDRCGKCEAPIVFHRNELGRPAHYTADFKTRCWSCHRSLIADVKFHGHDKHLLSVQRVMTRWIKCQPHQAEHVTTLHRFYAVRAICGVLMGESSQHSSPHQQYLRFEMMSVWQRAKVLVKARPYLSDLDTALQRLCRDQGLRPSDVMWRSKEARAAFQKLARLELGL